MEQQMKQLLQKESYIEAGYRAQLFSSCKSCRRCPSTDLTSGRTLCQYCVKYEKGPTIGLASLDLSAALLVQRLSQGKTQQVKKQVVALIEEKVQQLLRLKEEALLILSTQEIEGVDLAEELVELKLRLAQGENRIELIGHLKQINQQFRRRLLSKEKGSDNAGLLADLQERLRKIGCISELGSLINIPGEEKTEVSFDSLKIRLKQKIQLACDLNTAVRMRDGRTIIGCEDGLYELIEKERKLILGGGRINALAKDQKGTICGTSDNIENHSLFTLDDNLKVKVILEKAPVKFFGLSKAKNKFYFTAKQHNLGKVKLLENGLLREVVAIRKDINSLACFEDSLFIGEVDKVKLINKDGKVQSELTRANGLHIKQACGLCIFQNILFISDTKNRRVLVAKINEGQLTSVKQLAVEGVQFGRTYGLHMDLSRKELLICDDESQSLIVLRLD